ncbi:MAG TPA: SPW repeat protein, partial [Tepidisphaeraceae bacterium]|nr:SPW repeat protein [Tepidisphaeraceae bacterium]
MAANNMTIGLIFLLLMAVKAAAPGIKWIGWAGIIAGLWIMYSPWALLFARYGILLRNDVLTGIVLVGASSAAVFATLA